MNAPTVANASPVAAAPIAASLCGAGGRDLLDIFGVLKGFGISDPQTVLGELPEIVEGSIQTAASGVIQDPAGSAVGGSFSGAAGASGAIYAYFDGLPNDADRLLPIPSIPSGAAIFNASTGLGRRVLHTHSPSLSSLDPADSGDRGTALSRLSNAYFNALQAFDVRRAELGDDGTQLNLIPVSAGIYAGRFANKRPEWRQDHLEPSYSIASISVALWHAKASGIGIPRLFLYYHDPDVFQTAAAVSDSISGKAKGSAT